MSPEQAAGERAVDGRSDLFALGCPLFEMLAGEPPFGGDTPQSQLISRFTQLAPSLQAHRPEVSAALDQALRRALAREPVARFDSVADFLVAASVPIPGRDRRSARRRRRRSRVCRGRSRCCPSPI